MFFRKIIGRLILFVIIAGLLAIPCGLYWNFEVTGYADNLETQATTSTMNTEQSELPGDPVMLESISVTPTELGLPLQPDWEPPQVPEPENSSSPSADTVTFASP